MAETITTSIPAQRTEQQEPRHFFASWQRIALGAIMLISIFMNFYRLGQMGFAANLYYAAGVRSMLDNWHNFFFNAYDPGGFTALDKPPLGFWLQVLSAKIFGFNPISVLLPQTVCGVLAVLLLYSLIRPRFGVAAGLLAALVLALSPISILTNRNTTIDSTLTLVLLVGAWTVLRAAETGRLRWLLLSAAMIGLGFNIKMLQAFLVLPAFALLYLLAAPIRIWKRLWHLMLALLLLLMISLSWALIVDLTPGSQRPHVGATQSNSVIELALGYNGIERLLGGVIKSGNAPAPAPKPANGQPVPINGKAGADDAPGPLRLFSGQFGEQIGWLLPLAIFGAIALMRFRRPRPQPDHMRQGLILWGMWLLTMGIFFSIAQFFHEYYLTVMAPAIATFCGIGLVTMWRDYYPYAFKNAPHGASETHSSESKERDRRSAWRAWLLPVAITITAADQIFILTRRPEWGQWMIPLIGGLCLLTVGTLIIVCLPIPRLPLRFIPKVSWSRILRPALVPGLLALMLAPTLWAAIPIFQGAERDLPMAGPAGHLHSKKGAESNSTLLRYLEANQGNASILVATIGVFTDEIILATNKPVMPLDGFSSYPLTTTELVSLVAQGKLRFLLINQPEQGIVQRLQQVNNWAMQHCRDVPSSQWQTSSTSPGHDTAHLYDCASAH